MKQLTRTAFACLLLLLLMAEAAFAQPPAPKLVPVPPSASQMTAIREGVALHDKGNFEAAIAKYQEALKENPDNVLALYEMAYAYAAKKETAKALETAYRAAQYKSDHLGAVYTLIGNILDLQGDPKKAVEVYKAGIKLAPEDGGLHFNLAITQRATGKLEDARKSVKRAVVFTPEHRSSHLLLGSLFHNGQYKTPALLALLRFLVLEPRTDRSAAALRLTNEIMGGGVSAGEKPDEINIFLNMSTKKDEGDFDSIDVVLGLSKAVSLSKEEKGKTEAEKLISQFETFLAVLSEMDAKKLQSNFTGKYYAPYFIELKRLKYVEPFVYYTHQRSASVPGAERWLAQNSARVEEFLNWSKNYRWPRVE
jgi:tetratricopeptide (TPR) repeat protein